VCTHGEIVDAVDVTLGRVRGAGERDDGLLMADLGPRATVDR